MTLVLKLVAGAVLVASLIVAAALADLVLDGGRILYRLLGRDRIEAACRPKLEEALVGRGFAPADLELEPRPDLTVIYGREARLASDFTFTDGPEGVRVDGAMVCLMEGDRAHVEIRLRATPHRAA